MKILKTMQKIASVNGFKSAFSIHAENSPTYIVSPPNDVNWEWDTRTIRLDSLPHSDFSVIVLLDGKQILATFKERHDSLDAFYILESLDSNLVTMFSFKFYKSGKFKKEYHLLFDIENNKYKEIQDNSRDKELAGNLIVTLNYFLDLLLKKDLRLSKNKISFKISGKNEKTKYANHEVTYISTVKYLRDANAPKNYKAMTWSHSWIVRGHWRDISPKSIGKDRDGKRGIIGKTWVNEGVKKPELQIKNKMRIIK